jgi:hypothetical protein
MSYEIPEGAHEAVEALIDSITALIVNYTETSDKSEQFKASAVMCALTNVLVAEVEFHGVPAEALMESIVATLTYRTTFTDNHAVH